MINKSQALCGLYFFSLYFSTPFPKKRAPPGHCSLDTFSLGLREGVHNGGACIDQQTPLALHSSKHHGDTCAGWATLCVGMQVHFPLLYFLNHHEESQHFGVWGVPSPLWQTFRPRRMSGHKPGPRCYRHLLQQMLLMSATMTNRPPMPQFAPTASRNIGRKLSGCFVYLAKVAMALPWLIS